MRSRLPLPVHLAGRPFTLESSRSAGLDHNRLRHNDVEHISRGLYRPAAWDFCLEHAARALSEATPGAWISHVTAARLQSSLLPAWLSDSSELHLSKPTLLPGARRKGIHGHRLIVKPGEVESVEGIWISTRARTWLDMSRLLPLADLVAMADQLVRLPRPELEGREGAYSTIEELRDMVARHPNLQGVVRARRHWTWRGLDRTPRPRPSSGWPCLTLVSRSQSCSWHFILETLDRRLPTSDFGSEELLSSTTAAITLWKPSD